MPNRSSGFKASGKSSSLQTVPVKVLRPVISYLPGTTCQSLNVSQAVGRRGMLIQCSHWLGEDYIPRSGAGQVNPTQIRWAENEGGVAPQRKFWGTGNRDWAG